MRKADVDEVAEAIYMANWKLPDLDAGQRAMPTWENASSAVKDWVRRQATAAIEVCRYPESAPFDDPVPEL